MRAPFAYANPGERRNQSRPGWDQGPVTLARLERIVPPVFNAPTPHGPPPARERALPSLGAPVVAQAVSGLLPELTPALAAYASRGGREPAFSRGGGG